MLAQGPWNEKKDKQCSLEKRHVFRRCSMIVGVPVYHLHEAMADDSFRFCFLPDSVVQQSSFILVLTGRLMGRRLERSQRTVILTWKETEITPLVLFFSRSRLSGPTLATNTKHLHLCTGACESYQSLCIYHTVGGGNGKTGSMGSMSTSSEYNAVTSLLPKSF